MFQPDDKMLRNIFWSLAAVTFIYMILVVPAYGISGDGVTQYNYGTHVWNYIKTFGENKTVLTDEYILKKELQYYGGFFDGFAAMLIDVFAPKDVFLLRHYWCMLFGFIGLLSTGLFAREIGGWRAGILAMILLFFTGRYLGESFNNPKDPPFAATYILALYAMVIWLKNLENLKWKHTVLLGLAIALCLSIRIGGLLLFAYLGLFYALILWQKKLFGTKAFSKTLVHFALTCFIGYFVAILWWPFALEAPLSNPLEALRVMSSYPLQVKMLFEGQRIESTQVPWYYLPKWMLIGLPLYLIIGFTGGCILAYKMRKSFNSIFIWVLLFITIFPVLYILYKKAVLYDGLRHALFVVPPMAVIAALFYTYVGQLITKKGIQYAFAGLLLVLIALPARFMFANHPNEYVYFNELTGGIKGAYGNYETDYYMNSIKQGFEWLKENELSKLKNKDSVVVATNCVEPVSAYAIFSPVPIKYVYNRFYEKNEQDWDYGLYFGRFLDKEQLENEYFPSGMAIHIIEADGVPLCAVLKNDPERLGYKASLAIKANDSVNAIRYLTAATNKYPEDMDLWLNLSLQHLNGGNTQASMEALSKARSISKLDLQTEVTAGQIALTVGDINLALQIYGSMLENYPTFINAYLGLAKAQALQGSFDLAVENVNVAMEKAMDKQDGNLVRQGYMTMAFIYHHKGDAATAQKYYEASQKIQ